jgi:hypothetical protein
VNTPMLVLAILVVVAFEVGMARKSRKHIGRIDRARGSIDDAISRRRSVLDSKKAAGLPDKAAPAHWWGGNYY